MEIWRHGDMETWRHGDMETWKHGDMETWRHGDMETWRHGYMETWRHGYEDIKRKMEAQAIFLNLFTICSSCTLPPPPKWKFVICRFVGKETSKSYPLANGLNRLKGLIRTK